MQSCFGGLWSASGKVVIVVAMGGRGIGEKTSFPDASISKLQRATTMVNSNCLKAMVGHDYGEFEVATQLPSLDDLCKKLPPYCHDSRRIDAMVCHDYDGGYHELDLVHFGAGSCCPAKGAFAKS